MGKENDKNGPKIAQKARCFCTFSVFVLLKFLRVVAPSVIVGLTQGSHAIAEIPRDASRSSESVKRVILKITSWKSRGARAPVPHRLEATPMRVCLSVWQLASGICRRRWRLELTYPILTSFRYFSYVSYVACFALAGKWKLRFPLFELEHVVGHLHTYYFASLVGNMAALVVFCLHRIWCCWS